MPVLSRVEGRSFALVLVLAGCGLGLIDGVDDPTAGLPTAGAGPYARLDIDDESPALEPVVLADLGADFYEPAALARADGGIRVWFSRAMAHDFATAAIYRAELPSARDAPDVQPVLALAADQAWEDGRVSSPGIVETAAGLVMYYQAGASPSIGVARSTDGVTWTKDAGPVLADAEQPSAVIVDGVTWLFVTRPGIDGIWRAVDAGAGFAFDPAPVVTARGDLALAFDRTSVSDPFALAVALRGGGTRVHLWFVGTTEEVPGKHAIGYAASFDGVDWPRFGGDNAMLIPEATGPTVILEASRGLMLFAETYRGNLAIHAAEHP
jgi:hypothetical protein